MRCIEEVWKEAETHQPSLFVQHLDRVEYLYEGIKMTKYHKSGEIVFCDIRNGNGHYQEIDSYGFVMRGWQDGCLFYNLRKIIDLVMHIRVEISDETNTSRNKKRVLFLQKKIDKLMQKHRKFSTKLNPIKL